jgi:protocatechuate 3,4-dioxygenase beta subunit
MYFPDDPLFPYDPIMLSVQNPEARARMIARFDMESTVESWALAYEWDIVLRGRDATPMENPS